MNDELIVQLVKAATGHTSTQSVNLQPIHLLVTTCAIMDLEFDDLADGSGSNG
jgi:hypothetical protein